MTEQFALSAYLFTGVSFLVSLLVASILRVPFKEIRLWILTAWIFGVLAIWIQTYLFPHVQGCEGLILISMATLTMRKWSVKKSHFARPPVLFVVFAVFASVILVLGAIITSLAFERTILATFLQWVRLLQLYEDLMLWMMLGTVVTDKDCVKNALIVLWILGLGHLQQEFWPSFFSLVFILYLPMWALFSITKFGFILGFSYHFLYNYVYESWEFTLGVEMILLLMVLSWILILLAPDSLYQFQKDGQHKLQSLQGIDSCGRSGT